MAGITCGNLDDDVTYRLCLRAADSGCSTEKEVRLILRDAFGREPPSFERGEAIRPARGILEPQGVG